VRMTVLFALAAGLVLLGGCTHSRVDAEWGEAYRATGRSQIADPSAPRTLAAPEGTDAVTAELVAERYYTGQRTQETRRAPAVVIGELE